MRSLQNWLSLGVLTISGALLSVNLPVKADTCTALPLIGEEGTQGTTVEKTVSPPGASVAVRNNWNTDFAVEPPASFNRYVSTITAKDGGEYTIKMNLKYSDETSDEVYNDTVSLTPGKPLNIAGTPRSNETPYQVNVYVGELNAVGQTYNLSASGCN